MRPFSTHSKLDTRRLFKFLFPVIKLRSFLNYWLPVLVWMLVIFSASSDTKSFQHSSRILEPVIRWLFPHMLDRTVWDIVYVLRKCAHLTEYAVLALLLLRALRKPVRHDARPWRWADAGWAILLVILYAASDEIHQLFVPLREGKIGDVIIDASGGIAGLLMLWVIGRLTRHW